MLKTTFTFLIGFLLACTELQDGKTEHHSLADTVSAEILEISDTLAVYLPRQREGATHYDLVPLSELDYPLSRTDALESIGKRLSETYFSSYGDRVTSISFTVEKIRQLCADTACLHIGLIAIHDPEDILMTMFFQGSTGGQTTYNVLTASFLQPRMNDPLLDGVAFSVNGAFIPELSHIDLSGVQVDKLLASRLQRMIARK